MIFELFSNRGKKLPDVYKYDELPEGLKVQIVYLFEELFESTYTLKNAKHIFIERMVKTLRRERGYIELPHTTENWSRTHDFVAELYNYFLQEENTEYSLDVVEVVFRQVHTIMSTRSSAEYWAEPYADVCIELNERFKQHGVGYFFSEGRIFRIDNEYIHSEVVKPALVVLHQKKFLNAQVEYLKAHEHYRHGRLQECMVECLKAVETVIKIIGHERKWKINQTDSASKLINALFDNGLLPKYLSTNFTNAMKLFLESGVPTVRNKAGGHGQGISSTNPPAYLASFLLGSAAAIIKLIADADNSSP